MSARRERQRAKVVRVRCDGCGRVYRLSKMTGGGHLEDGTVVVKPCPACGSETGTYA